MPPLRTGLERRAVKLIGVLGAYDDQIVFVDDYDFVALGAEEVVEVVAFFAGAAGGVEHVQAREAAAHFDAIGADQAHRVAGVELAGYAREADR